MYAAQDLDVVIVALQRAVNPANIDHTGRQIQIALHKELVALQHAVSPANIDHTGRQIQNCPSQRTACAPHSLSLSKILIRGAA